jgi:23S rRNA (cytosine1962-C5)-methyltransferase
MDNFSFSQLINALTTRFSDALPQPVRLFHGRGHLYAGQEHINVDWYPPVVQIILYEAVGEANLQELVTGFIEADTGNQIQSIIVQQRYLQHAPVRQMWGEANDTLVVDEAGLKFEVQPGVHQNSGLFLDTSTLRKWLRSNSDSKSILNLFSYTCSLSVAAIAGGAAKVVNVDMSRTAIEWGKRNHQLNDHDPRSVQYIPHNLFRSWGKIQQLGRYDLIIIDPPARQRGSFDSEKNYGTILKRIKKLAKPGAEIIATLNSPWLNRDFLPDLMNKHAPQCQFIDYLPASPDFADRYPDRALKIYHFKYTEDPRTTDQVSSSV